MDYNKILKIATYFQKKAQEANLPEIVELVKQFDPNLKVVNVQGSVVFIDIARLGPGELEDLQKFLRRTNPDITVKTTGAA